MPYFNTTVNEWDDVVTTTVDTVFQNRDEGPIWITTEDPTSSDLDEGVELQAGDAIVIGSGNDVSASSKGAVRRLYYVAIGEVTP